MEEQVDLEFDKFDCMIIDEMEEFWEKWLE